MKIHDRGLLSEQTTTTLRSLFNTIIKLICIIIEVIKSFVLPAEMLKRVRARTLILMKVSTQLTGVIFAEEKC